MDVLLQLIPQNVEIDSIVSVKCLLKLVNEADLRNLPDIPEIIARILLASKREEFFTAYDFSSVHSPPISRTKRDFCFWSFQVHRSLQYSVDVGEMQIISVLVRKGLGAQVIPQCSATIAKYRGEGHVFVNTDTLAETNSKYDALAKKANEIDDLCDGPLSLFDQCCFTIRKRIQTPKYEKLYELPLPPLVLDQLTFLDLGGNIHEMIKDNNVK